MVTSQAGDTASATLRAHAMIVAATAVVASIRRRQRDFLADPRSVLDRPVLADTTDPVVAAFVAAYDEAVETLGECTPRLTRGVPRGRCPPLMQRNTLRPLQISTPAGRPDAASTRTCTHPWMCVGWTSFEEARASLELATHAWPASAATRHCHRAAQLTEELGIGVPDLLIPAWQALLDEPATVAAALS